MEDAVDWVERRLRTKEDRVLVYETWAYVLRFDSQWRFGRYNADRVEN